MEPSMWNIERIVSKGDYNYAVVPSHPKAIKFGYVLEHRIVMENYLCRSLDDDEVVHHKNGNKKDNRIENLEIMTNSEHARMHQNDHGRKWAKLCCPSCKSIFERPYNRTHVFSKTAISTSCSPSCRGKFSRLIQLHGKTVEVDNAISGNILEVFTRFKDNPEETV